MQAEMQAETTPNKPKQRTLQEVFNVVLDAGLYGAGKPYYFMCSALKHAVGYHEHAPIITEAEYRCAKRSIGLYLRLLTGPSGESSYTLAGALGVSDDNWRQHLPTLEGIYRNWAKRPRRPLAGRGSAVAGHPSLD